MTFEPRVFFAHALFVLAAWTLVIKFAFPMAWALHVGGQLLEFVWWDFWWVVHLWLGWSLLVRPRYLRWLAVVTACSEVAIVTTKFVLFLSAPEWSIWSTNWFINKVFVLAIFTAMLLHLVVAPQMYQYEEDSPLRRSEALSEN